MTNVTVAAEIIIPIGTSPAPDTSCLVVEQLSPFVKAVSYSQLLPLCSRRGGESSHAKEIRIFQIGESPASPGRTSEVLVIVSCGRPAASLFRTVVSATTSIKLWALVTRPRSLFKLNDPLADPAGLGKRFPIAFVLRLTVVPK